MGKEDTFSSKTVGVKVLKVTIEGASEIPVGAREG